MVSLMARRSAVPAVVIAIVLAAGSRARADEVGPTPTSPPAASPAAPPAFAGEQRRLDREEETTWYGWQTLAADGTSLLVLPTVAGVTQSAELGVVALAGYFLAPPFIHGAHGRWGIFAASLGLRVGMPFVGGLLGSAADADCSGELCIPVGAAFGVVLGALGAVALDASLLSYEKVETDARGATARRSNPSHLAWSPTLAPRKEGGFTLGLGASF